MVYHGNALYRKYSRKFSQSPIRLQLIPELPSSPFDPDMDFLAQARAVINGMEIKQQQDERRIRERSRCRAYDYTTETYLQRARPSEHVTTLTTRNNKKEFRYR